MKAKMYIIAALLATTVTANAMPYGLAREEALFLSDKMAYELDLTESQYEAVYEINLDYLLNVDDRFDVFGTAWTIRNRDLRFVLSGEQYNDYMDCEWFYRPVAWNPNGWSFTIYDRYNRGRLFMHRPEVFVSFRGGHNHRDASFYAGFHFERPTRTIVHGNGGHRPVVISDGRPHMFPTNHGTIAPTNRPTVIHIDGRPHHVPGNNPQVIQIDGRPHHVPGDAPVRSFGINRR